jgi:hypothetical protein
MRVRGQAGDPSYLRVIQSCIVERNRLEGTHKERRKNPGTIEGRVLHAHLHAIKNGDDNPFLAAGGDAVIEAKSALNKLLFEAKKRDESK